MNAYADGLQRLQRRLIARGSGAHLCTDEPLARHTSFAIGGPADLLLVAHTPEELADAVCFSQAEGVPALVLGGGTNVLVADAGVRGLVVLNQCRAFSITDDGLLLAQSGAALRQLAQWAVERGWAGLEWAVGIPGTLGGAVVGNAGAYGGCMADSVRWAMVLYADGRIERLEAEALQYGYRCSALKDWARSAGTEDGVGRPVVLDAALQLARGDAQELAARAHQNNTERCAKTPGGCSAGSVFKRTLQFPAGFLIERAGLKGRRIGGALVSPKHANFILNTGGATAADVRALIEAVQREVWSVWALRLEPEIEFVGDWG